MRKHMAYRANAILLSVILLISVCLPPAGMQVFAADNGMAAESDKAAENSTAAGDHSATENSTAEGDHSATEKSTAAGDHSATEAASAEEDRTGGSGELSSTPGTEAWEQSEEPETAAAGQESTQEADEDAAAEQSGGPETAAAEQSGKSENAAAGQGNAQEADQAGAHAADREEVPDITASQNADTSESQAGSDMSESEQAGTDETAQEEQRDAVYTGQVSGPAYLRDTGGGDSGAGSSGGNGAGTNGGSGTGTYGGSGGTDAEDTGTTGADDTDTTWPTSDELYEAYMLEAFGLHESIPDNIKAKKESIGKRLTGMDRQVYDYVSAQLPAIAAGELASTSFSLPMSVWEGAPWTKEDLGISDMFAIEDGKRVVSAELKAALDKKASYNYLLVNNILMQDNPVNMYWYDKTQGVHVIYPKYVVQYDEAADDWKVSFTTPMILEFTVSRDYSDGSEYKVDTSKGQTVLKAAANADAIVDQYSGGNYSDVTRLSAFSHEITDLASYNTAASVDGYPYGDPFQLVWVFDDDPETKVVCEGYAKAFQYLCDRTTFDSDRIECITVYGYLDNEQSRHAWNVVQMEDGLNYLVDVTNSADGMVGAGDKLFLVGAPGDVDDYYAIRTDEAHTVKYKYGDNMFSMFREDELALSDHNYSYRSIRGAVIEFDRSAFQYPDQLAYDYDGDAKKPPVLSVTLDGEKLSEDDYQITRYAQNVNAGTAKVIVTGIGAYGGTAEGKFTINKIPYPGFSLESDEITIMPHHVYSYWNERRESSKPGWYYFGVMGVTGGLDIEIDDKSVVEAVRDSDGFQSGFEGVAPGTATLTFTAAETSNYLPAVRTLIVHVGQYDLSSSGCEVAVEGKAVYDGGEKKPAVTVTYDKVPLIVGEDYTVRYSNNVNAGSKAVVEVTGCGKTAVSGKTVFFDIAKAAQKLSLKSGAAAWNVGTPVAVAAGQAKQFVIGGAVGKVTASAAGGGKAAVSVVGAAVAGGELVGAAVADGELVGGAVAGEELVGGAVAGGGNALSVRGVSAGTCKVTVRAAETNNYAAGELVITVNILPGRTSRLIASNQPKGIKLTWAKVPGANGYLIYRGGKLLRTIKSGATVSFIDTGAAVNGRKYSYKVVAKSSLGVSPLSEPQSFYYVSPVKFKSLVNRAGRKMTLKWAKNAKATGYEIQYSLTRDFKKVKKSTISKKSTVAKTIAGLTKGRTYYVKIRAYKKVGKIRYYSAFSAVKKVKISK